ncbi:MAG: hypothetical protein ABF773_10510, partial [Lentilactobacillus hilgardii]
KPTVLTCRFPTFYGCLLHPKKVTLSNGAVLTQNFTLTYWVLLIMVVISLAIFAFIKKPIKK